jgi:DNA-binding transcriptional MocR family regulator
MNERGAGAPVPQPERRAFAAIVRAKPLHDTVVERLRDMIVEGELASGERLHDANLAKILQVSRTPIREATKRSRLERRDDGAGSPEIMLAHDRYCAARVPNEADAALSAPDSSPQKRAR